MSRFPLLSALISISFSVCASAQQTKVFAPHDPIAPKVSKPIAMKPAALGSIAGGPWMVDANFKSIIYLKNIVETSPISVTPVLHLSNGTKYQLPAVQLQAAGTAALDVNSSLQALGIAPYATLSGWVELQYTWSWVPLCAVIRNIDVAHSLIFTFGYEAPGPASADVSQAAKPQVAEGLWWKQESNVTGFLTLANTTSQPVKALVQISDNLTKVLGTYNVTISPEGMKTLDLKELESAPTTEGGIRVSYVGQPESLLINGGLEDPNVGYSAGLRFAPPVRPAPPMSHATTPQGIAEVGLMAGAADPMMHFPAGTTFTPYSILHNNSTGPLSVTPTLWWMQAGNASSFHLPQFTMLPDETRSLNLPSLLSSAGLKNFNGSFNVVFDTQGSPGLLIAGGSVDQTNTYVFEVASRGIVNSAGKSLSYWSTGNGDDTMVMLWNPADEEQNLIFRVMFAGGHYDYPIQLGPKVTRTFNISDVINSAVPDAQGNTVPAGIQEGSAVIVGDQADNQNILLVMDSGVYNVRKATCGGSCQNCDGVTSALVSLNPFAVAVSGQWQENFTAQYCSGSQYNFTGQSTWSSNNTSVATVQGGLVHGVSTGSMSVGAGYSSAPVCAPQCSPYGSCPAFTGTGGSAPGTIAQLSCTTSVTRGSSTTCTVTPTGVTVSNWKFTDGSNHTVTRDTNLGSLTWSGIAVTSGTVSVMVSGATAPLTASVTVSPRNSGFAFTAVIANKETNPYTCVSGGTSTVLSVNATPQAGNSSADVLGEYCDIESYSYNFITLTDHGPNQGYSYITNATNNASFHWIIANDVDNPSSQFYQAQCGNYNASTNAGFIAGSQLRTNITRHESGTVQGHYGKYVTAQNDSTKNVGTGLESTVDLSSGTTFQNFVSNTLVNRTNAISQATLSPDPYDANHDQNGVFNGPINFSPYASCQ